MSAVVSVGAIYWARVESLGYLPLALIGLGVFTASIWAINGVIWMRRQNGPSRERLAFDSIWGLAIDGTVPSIDFTNTDNTLEIRILLRNATSGPLKVCVEDFTFTIEDRFFKTEHLNFILQMATVKTVFPHGGFSEQAYNNFKDRTTGTVQFSARYGHPSAEFGRRYIAVLRLHIFKFPGNITINWVAESETDDSL